MEAPTPEHERIDALDVVRGVALFGVLQVNIITGFRVSLFDAVLPRSRWAPAIPQIDQNLLNVMSTYFESKAFALFSLLFGIGLGLQRQRQTTRHLVRRQVMLLVIGLVHMFLIWNGDILALYAIVGLIAIPCLRLPRWALVVLAVAVLATKYLPIPYPLAFSSLVQMKEHVDDAHTIYGHGTFLQVLAFRIHEVRPMVLVLLWSAPRVLGLFLIGAALGGGPTLRKPDFRWFAVAALLGIGFGIEESNVVVLAMGYGAALFLAAPYLRFLAPLGRMALTSYLLQSVVLGAIFYGYGLGLFGRTSVAVAGVIGWAIYILQVVLSHVWLRYFVFGPVEWLWRSVTYGAKQPFRRRA